MTTCHRQLPIACAGREGAYLRRFLGALCAKDSCEAEGAVENRRRAAKPRKRYETEECREARSEAKEERGDTSQKSLWSQGRVNAEGWEKEEGEEAVGSCGRFIPHERVRRVSEVFPSSTSATGSAAAFHFYIGVLGIRRTSRRRPTRRCASRSQLGRNGGVAGRNRR
jgi:hypothetical protein